MTKSGKPKSANKLKKLGSTANITCLLIILVSSVIGLFIIKDIFAYEFHHAYTADSPLYWSVGRGILNGITPYSGMYENKPPAIFLISALSFQLTGTTIICNIVSSLAVLIIAFLPTIIVISHFERLNTDDVSILRNTAVFVTLFLSGLLIAVYTETRCGGFQVEAIGAAFSLVFICLVIKLKNAETKKQKIILTVCSALAISCTVMIKEPFLLVSIFGALLFVDNFKHFVKHVVLPCIVGGVICVSILAATGVLVPYFSIYIKRMFETRLSGDSSAFTRARDLLRLTNDVKAFSKWLLYLLVFFLILTMLRILIKKKNSLHVLIHVLKVVVAIFVASFCVGMGGQYYNHHYIFAVPIYCAFLIYGGALLYEYKPKKAAASEAVILLWGMILMMLIPNIGNAYAGDYTNKLNSITSKAEYVDSLLDFYGEDRYQYIGFNGEDVFIGLTKHSPQGPVFAQDPDNFATDDTWFSQELIKQLNESDIIIFKDFKSPAINEYIQELLNTEFTVNPKKKYTQTQPNDFGCTIFYRTSKFG